MTCDYTNKYKELVGRTLEKIRWLGYDGVYVLDKTFVIVEKVPEERPKVAIMIGVIIDKDKKVSMEEIPKVIEQEKVKIKEAIEDIISSLP